MRILVVGLNPSRRLKNSPSIRTLNSWLDLLNIKIVSFINLYEGYSIDPRSNQRNRIKEMSKHYDKIIALGNCVSSNLNVVEVTHFQLPHPSGLNRQLNNHKFVDQRLSACKNYLYGD